MKIIGLTGGIASGKSSVARLLKMLGAEVIDADMLAREVVTPGKPAYSAIIDMFGAGILDPDLTINRESLGKIVFGNPLARAQLEAIMHPAIKDLAEQQIAELRTRGCKTVFYMAPLLIEAGAVDRVDEVWVVYVDRETQIQRLMKRDFLSMHDAGLRIASQMPMDEKIRHGRIVINNCGIWEETEKRIREIWEAEFPAGGN